MVAVLSTATMLGSCAGAPRAAPAAPDVVIDEAERQQCDPVARAAAASARAPSIGDLPVSGSTGTLFDVVILAIDLIAVPILLAQWSGGKAKAKREAYAAAMTICLAPRIAERTLGPDDPAVARAYREAATLFATQGSADEAVAASERVAALVERIKGPDDPDTVSALEDHVALLRRLGRSDAAARVQAQAQAIRSERWPHLDQDPVDLGAAAIGATGEAEVRLLNPASDPLVVESIVVNRSGWSALFGTCAAPVPPSGVCTLRVRFGPVMVPGRYEAALVMAAVRVRDEREQPDAFTHVGRVSREAGIDSRRLYGRVETCRR